MKTSIKIWSLGVLAATTLVGNTACTELLDESYSQVVSEKYSPTNDADISYLVNAAYIPWRQTMLLWNGVVRSEELCADQDVIPARYGQPKTMVCCRVGSVRSKASTLATVCSRRLRMA